VGSQSVFRSVLRHELVLHASSPAHLTVTVLMMVMIVLALYRGGQTYGEQRRAVQEAQLEEQAAWDAYPLDQWLWAGTRTGKWVYQEPIPSSVWTDGISRSRPLGYRVRVGVESAHRLDLTTGQQAWNPQLSRFGSLDLGFVLLVLAPLWIILLTFDAVSGEKARGTLKVLFSYPISRRAYLHGRVVGLLVWMLAPVLVALLIGHGINLAAGHFADGSIHPLRLIVFVAVAAAYLMCYAMAGLWASSRSTDPSISLMLLMVIWVAASFFIPRMGMIVGAQLHPPVTHMETALAKRAAIEEARRSEEGHGGSLSQTEAQALRIEQTIAREIDLDRAFAERKDRARETGVRLAMVSPMVVANFALMDVAGTGPARSQQFLTQVDEYRRAFSLYFAKHIRIDGEDKRAILANVPTFTYRDEPVRSVVGRTMPKLAWLGLLIVLLYFASVRAFQRYDLR
jgi:ABC-2 type transport system permease protein